MLQVDIALPSGQKVKLSIPQFSKVGDLQKCAQKTFGQGFFRLATAEGRLLTDSLQTLDAMGIRDGDCVTAIVQQAKLSATSQAFALWCCGGDRIVTWGRPQGGGDSTGVKDQLKNVEQIQGTEGAFAAILADRSVVTWGYPGIGGDSTGVQDKLKNVEQIQGTRGAFAAILADRSVVTWGNAEIGGDSSGVQDQLKNVEQIQGTRGAFAAILADRSVVTWGNASWGGDSTGVKDQLKNVEQIQGTDGAFAAILADRSVVTWGHASLGGDSSGVQDQLKNVEQIQGIRGAFAAILADRSVVTWGTASWGGDSTGVKDQLKNVEQIQGTDGAFAAILADRSVVTWGMAGFRVRAGSFDFGGDSSDVQDQLKNVEQIQGTDGAFAAILADRSVVTWGNAEIGGDSSGVQDQLKNVEQIQGTRGAFATILADRSVVTWGRASWGGDSSGVQDEIRNVGLSWWEGKKACFHFAWFLRVFRQLHLWHLDIQQAKKPGCAETMCASLDMKNVYHLSRLHSPETGRIEKLGWWMLMDSLANAFKCLQTWKCPININDHPTIPEPKIAQICGQNMIKLQPLGCWLQAPQGYTKTKRPAASRSKIFGCGFKMLNGRRNCIASAKRWNSWRKNSEKPVPWVENDGNWDIDSNYFIYIYICRVCVCLFLPWRLSLILYVDRFCLDSDQRRAHAEPKAQWSGGPAKGVDGLCASMRIRSFDVL